jgi:hypothetical protein
MHSDEPERIVRKVDRVPRTGGRFNVHVYAFWSSFTLWRFLKYGASFKRHFENSLAPVHIDLYAAPKLQRLFGYRVTIEKPQCKPFGFLASWFGWFLVVRGERA